MAFRFVRSAGSVHEPATVLMYASGVVHPGGVVIRDATNNMVSPGTSASTTTNIFGIALDYAQGASDTQVRVIPFVQGQLWEADTANVISTANILIRHQLATDTVLRNVTGTSGADETLTTGVFLAYAITGATSGSGKIIGTFLQRTPSKSDGFTYLGS